MDLLSGIIICCFIIYLYWETIGRDAHNYNLELEKEYKIYKKEK